MMKIEKGIGDKRLVSVLGIICGLLVLFVGMIPLLNRWTDLNHQIKLKKGTYEQQVRLIHHMDDFKKEFVPYKETLLFAKGETEEKVNAHFLKEIEKIIQGAGLQIVDVKVLPIEEEDGAKRFLIQIEAEGLVNQLTSLLYEIGSADALIQVDNLAIERKDAVSSILTIKTVFSKVKV